MAGFNYNRAKSTADRLIRKFGQAGFLQKYTPPANRTSRPSYSPVPIRLVVVDYRDDQVDGTRILRTDKQIIISTRGLTQELTVNDRIEDANGSNYEVISSDVLNPGGTVVIYTVQGRR